MHLNETHNHLRLYVTNISQSNTWTNEEFNIANQQYEYWKCIWNAQFKKKSPEFVLSSDNFMRQKEIYSLHVNDKIIALIAADIFDLNHVFTRDHSYFSEIPEDVFQTLKEKKALRCFTINQLLVSQKWYGDARVVDIMAGLILHRLYTSFLKWAICYTRNIGKINTLGLRWTGQSIKSDFLVHNEPSDFVLFNKDSYLSAEIQLEKKIVTNLWDEYFSKPSQILKLNTEFGWNFNNYKQIMTKGELNEPNTYTENSL